jgi:hypothetical protein
MRRTTQLAPLAALVAAAAIAAAGCGDDPSAAAPPPSGDPTGSGYFVGKGSDGLGAAVDFMVDDPVTARARSAIGRAAAAAGEPAPAVGLASLVNDSGLPSPVPAFIAVLPGGGATPVQAARGPASGLARPARVFPSPPLFVPAEGTATVYVVLRGASPAEVDHLKMVVRPGESVRLDARRR